MDAFFGNLTELLQLPPSSFGIESLELADGAGGSGQRRRRLAADNSTTASEWRVEVRPGAFCRRLNLCLLCSMLHQPHACATLWLAGG